MFGAKRATSLLLFATWALVGVVSPGPSAAQPGPVFDRVVQRFQPPSPEPPLADGTVTPRAGDNWTPAGADPNEPPTPVVSIQVHVPAVANAGQELEYRIVVENRSRAAAHHVLVRDKVPDTARFVKAAPEPKDREPELRWDLGTMQGGTRKEIILTLVPTGAGDVENTARVQFDHGQRVKTALSKPTLRVREVGPAQGVIGAVLKYQIEVTNVGSADAVDVDLTNMLPVGGELTFSNSEPSTPGDNPLRWRLGTIAPGQTRRVKYEVIAAKAGTWSTKVRASTKTVAEDASTTITVGEPKLSVIKTGPSRRLVNRAAAYQITVANPGTVALTGVQVVDRIPADITFLSASGGGQHVGGQVQWDLGNIPAGGRKVVQMVIRSAKPGELTNVAEVRADHDLRARDAVLTTFENPKTLAIEIEKNVDPVDVGREAIYTIRVLNPTGQGATNLALAIFVPEELRVIDARGPTQADKRQPKVTFASLPALGAGLETAYTLRVQAANPGAARLKVELTADSLPPGTVISQDENVTVVEPK